MLVLATARRELCSLPASDSLVKTIQTHKSCTLKTLGSVALVAVILAFTSSSLLALTTLTVTISSDNTPGGQIDSATSGDLRYCINYILNQQAQGIAQDYNVVFAPGVNSIQLSAKLSMVNLLGSDTIVIGNPDPATPVVITGGPRHGRIIYSSRCCHSTESQFPKCKCYRRQWR